MCPCQSNRDNECFPWPKTTDPESLIPRSMAHTANRNGNWNGAMGRLEWNGLFATIVTQPAPLKSTGRLLHPSLDRFVTIRELARGQCFPDGFKFHELNKAALQEVIYVN